MNAQGCSSGGGLAGLRAPATLHVAPPSTESVSQMSSLLAAVWSAKTAKTCLASFSSTATIWLERTFPSLHRSSPGTGQVTSLTCDTCTGNPVCCTSPLLHELNLFTSKAAPFRYATYTESSGPTVRRGKSPVPITAGEVHDLPPVAEQTISGATNPLPIEPQFAAVPAGVKFLQTA